jgi:hypothetical protein
VAVDDPLDDGQADAIARELPLRMQPLERPEQFVRVGHVESGTVVPHEECRTRRGVGPPERSGGGGCLRSELPGVAEQVLKRHPQQRGVPRGEQARLDVERHLPLRLPPFQFVQYRARQGSQIDKLVLHLVAVEPGEQEHVVDEMAHALGAGPQPPEVVLPFFVEHFAGVTPQQFIAEPVEGPQGRSQVVRDTVGERLHLLVCRLQLGRSLDHTVLQVPVDSLQLLADPHPVGHILDREQNHRGAVHVIGDAVGVEKHDLDADVRKVVLDLEVLERTAVPGDRVEYFPQPRDVPLAAAEFVDEAAFRLLPDDAEGAVEGGAPLADPQVPVKHQKGVAHRLDNALCEFTHDEPTLLLAEKD